MNAIFEIPKPINEPVLSYAPGTPERAALKSALNQLKSQTIEVPMQINGQSVFTGQLIKLSPPHEHAHTLGHAHEGTAQHIEMAISACLEARDAWAAMPWQQRAGIFLKAADLLAGPYRAKINAATMLGQSKNAYQAEIDAACELIDFLRFNAYFMSQIYAEQPVSSAGIWNRLEYRPLEGFTVAITPFNFTAIAGNLACCMAMMGNVVVWKPSYTQIYSTAVILEVLEKSGLPAGVINTIFVDGPILGEVAFKHPSFAGVHFTGSTAVFKTIWKNIGQNIDLYKTYPRIVGETGGKDFVLAHSSADVQALAVGLIRGAFEYQGQKCSAASRAYIPESLWPKLKPILEHEIAQLKMGSTEDFGCFVNAVIDERAFDKITSFIDRAAQDADSEVIIGGKADKTVGYFIEPTVILTQNPRSLTMVEEIFGPVLTMFVYADDDLEATIDLVDGTSAYALTGAVFAQDRTVLQYLEARLVNAAGNMYLNDKPTGAVVGQQPFGGARASGTNDKAGSKLNLLRWVSPRTIKEALVSPMAVSYPFLSDK